MADVSSGLSRSVYYTELFDLLIRYGDENVDSILVHKLVMLM